MDTIGWIFICIVIMIWSFFISFVLEKSKNMDNNLFYIDWLKKMWGNGNKFIYKGESYTVHKMSYGDYFFEPVGWTGGETDGFAPGTLWLVPSEDKKGFYKAERSDF